MTLEDSEKKWLERNLGCHPLVFLEGLGTQKKSESENI
jgi:hypothetical protein